MSYEIEVMNGTWKNQPEDDALELVFWYFDCS